MKFSSIDVLRVWYIFVVFFALFAPTIFSLLGQNTLEYTVIPLYIAVTVFSMVFLLEADIEAERQKIKGEMK